MATTATPYGAFLTDLGSGVHNFGVDTDKIALFTSAYTPNLDTDASLADISANQISSSGTGYTAGGATLTGVAVTYDSVNHRAQISAGNTTFAGLTATFRYAVVYKSTGTASTSKLIGLFDFGTDRSYTGEDFVLVFSSGVVRIRKAS